ncbi:hypothetical protein HK096_010858 [Nowakowskiella sp. JEL0078]|nr:hypothetical protein HK096_010858 [Nowakowskiella sp. JEL0078]
MQQLQDFLKVANDVGKQERKWMSEYKPSIVCVDAAYIPLKEAKILGIPSVIVSNFTFDSIFAHLITPNPGLSHAITGPCFSSREPSSYFSDSEIISQMTNEYYSQADYLIRLPGCIPIPGFPASRKSHVIDVPLVVRMHRQSRQETRAVLGIDDESKILLVSFGGHDLVFEDENKKLLPEGWFGIVASPNSKSSGKFLVNPNSVNQLESRFLSVDTSLFWMPDLINAVDVVLGKCGYGMCSEVVAHKTPLIYVPRPDFIEEQGLISNLMEPYGYGIQMAQLDFYKGNWKDHILMSQLLLSKDIKKEIRTNGGNIIGCALLQIASETKSKTS